MIISEDTLGKYQTTNRGFSFINFTDRYGQKCSLQTSSALDFYNEDNEDASEEEQGAYRYMLWLGVDDVTPKIMASDAIRLGLPNYGKNTGWVEYKIPEEVLLSSRMHLTVVQVKALIADLQRWVEANE